MRKRLPPWLAPARNELPAKITVAGAKEEGTARVRVINEPDVLVVEGGLAAGPDRPAQGCWPGLLCLGREVEARSPDTDTNEM